MPHNRAAQSTLYHSGNVRKEFAPENRHKTKLPHYKVCAEALTVHIPVDRIRAVSGVGTVMETT